MTNRRLIFKAPIPSNTFENPLYILASFLFYFAGWLTNEAPMWIVQKKSSHENADKDR
jgi:hypothetical protein